jgi:hypothetical protein
MDGWMKRVLHPGAYNSLLWKCSTFLCCNVCRREKNSKKRAGTFTKAYRIGITHGICISGYTMAAHHHDARENRKKKKDLA